MPSTSSARSIGESKLACSVNSLMRSFMNNNVAGESVGLKAGHRRAATVSQGELRALSTKPSGTWNDVEKSITAKRTLDVIINARPRKPAQRSRRSPPKRKPHGNAALTE